MDDPLLPLPYMLKHVADSRAYLAAKSAENATTRNNDEPKLLYWDDPAWRSGYQLLLYVRCCFRGEHYPPVAALEYRLGRSARSTVDAAVSSQYVCLCVLAFMLWATPGMLARKLGIDGAGTFQVRHPPPPTSEQCDLVTSV